MANEGGMMNIPGLKGIRRALDKNQTFTNELKKELHHIDAKRKTCEKAFEMKRNQFMRKSLCLNSPGKQRRLGVAEHFTDNFSSHSAGNILDSMQGRREHSMEITNYLIQRRNHKLSLDSSFYMRRKVDNFSRLNSGKKMEKSLSWGEESSSNGLQDSFENAISTTVLEVPPLPSFLQTQSSEDLRPGSQGCHDEDNHLNQSHRKSSTHLLEPSFERKRSRSFEHLTMPRIRAHSQSKTESSRMARQHSYCEERSQCETHQNRLVLPPLTRPRSKSFDVMVEKGSRNQRLRAKSDTDYQQQSNRLPKQPSSLRSAKHKNALENRKGSFTETTKGDTWVDDGCSHREPGTLRRSSSTPDLTDLGSEVEYLLLDDDRTRLQRMRASDRAQSLINDNLQDCRYIRSASNSSGTELPTIHPRPESDEEDDAFLDMIKNNPTEFTCGETGNETKPINDSSVGDSNTSTLAEMFEEIKKTRYLRMPGKSNEEDIDDVLMTSHGYQTPLIILGHTKYVFPEEKESEKTDQEVF